MNKPRGADRDIAVNRRASHDYHFEEEYEAGLVLTGSEVKSLRDARITFKDSYISVRNGELFWLGVHISPWTYAHHFNHEAERERKLLLHRTEINRLATKVRDKGLTLIPLKVYLKNGRLKLKLALARGKKEYDRREDIKEREANREMDRALKARR